MKNIINLKSWYTIDQAADRLRLEFEQDISRLDLLQLVSDQKLNISWLRNHKLYREVKTTDHHLRKKGTNELISSTNSPIPMIYPVFEASVVTINGPRPINLQLNQRVNEYITHLISFDEEPFNFERDHVHDCHRLGSIFGIILEIEGKLYEQVDDFGESLMPNEYPLLNELVFRRDDIDDFIMQVIKDNAREHNGNQVPSTKSKNKMIKVIGSLSDALIDGMSGVKNKDASAVLAALDLKGIDRPISQKKLAEYLAEAYEQE